jgi:hypothetical protein
MNSSRGEIAFGQEQLRLRLWLREETAWREMARTRH